MAKTSYAPSGAKIKVIGLGGAGCNAITRMVREQIRGVQFIAMNSDAQHLAVTEATVRIQLGEHITRGLGASGDHVVGRKAAEENRDEIKQVISGSDVTFIVAGMGGGTGTGSAPVVAEISKQSGALTIAVVTKPFTFEGTHRSQVAEEGIVELLNTADTVVIIPNDCLLELVDSKANVEDAFKLIDELLYHTVQAIAETVTVPGLINLDFGDIRVILKDAGPAWMSIGHGTGQNRAADAAKEALASPLLDVSIDGAKGALFNVVGSENLTLFEVNSAADVIRQAVDPEANIIFGVVLDPKLGEEVRVTLLVTGFATKESLAGLARERDVIRLIRGSKVEEELEVPSFFRMRRTAKPSPERKPAIDAAILAKGYSIFKSRSDPRERSSRLKKLRDQVVRTNPDDPAVELLNSLWRLSQDVTSVPDHASTMIRLLRLQSPEYEANPLYGFYSFISSACDINSASDFGRIPLKVIREINELTPDVSNIVEIPPQITRLFEMVESLSDQSLVRSHMDWLKRGEEVLCDLADSLKTEVQTPEVVCLAYVINRWLELVAGAIKISLSNLKCWLAINKPLYLNRVNEIQIAVSGGMPGQPLRISAPVTQNYDVQLHDIPSVFQDPATNIGLRITPHVAGPLTILIEIEGITFQIEALVFLENPFIVGVPVQSEEMFVGRQEIVNRIIRGIAAPQPTNFLITGRRRIGKTSLLYAIRRQLPKGFLPVLISTETCGKSPIEVCRALAKGISRAISEIQSTRSKKQQLPAILQDDPTGSFISWLETTRNRLSSSSFDAIVLLIDEALGLTEWDDRVQRLLRYIFSSMTWIRGVLAGPPDIIERMTEHVSSPLYNIFTTLKLGPIDINDTYKLIVVPLRNCGIAGAEDMLNTIYDYSGGIPYYIQAIGHELIENYFSNRLVGEELLSKSLTQVRARLKTSYPVTLKKLSAEQKVSIVLIAGGVNPPEVSAKRLEQADLIEREGSKWIIRARVEREWVEEYADQLLDSAGQELWDYHKKEIDLLQLAEDLRKLKKEFAASEEISEALTSAISAAEKENGAKTLKYLGKVGQWVLDTATKIGADVAATAIKHIYGLP
jgi:cell division protein FtsZ